LIKPKKLRDSARLGYIHHNLTEFLKDKAIYMGVLEAPSYGSVHKEFILGEVLGVIKLALIQLDILSIAIPPTQLKMFLTGKGTATKEAMIYQAQVKGCPSKQEDICDSWAAALLCKDLLLGPSTSNRKSLEALKKIKAKHSLSLSMILNKEI
jgi:Holliday junction resolvasome RuvABC endonuclease subunit